MTLTKRSRTLRAPGPTLSGRVDRMTKLEKSIRRKTSATRFEKSEHRAVIITLEPTATVGVRLEGTRQTYRLDAEVVYELAVRSHIAAIDKRTRELRKEGLPLRSARSKAAKE